MAKKREQIGNEIQGGELTHNPFAALGDSAASPSRGESQAPKKEVAAKRGGSRPKLVVRFEAKGHGGKTVTRVTGLDLERKELESLAKEVRKAMGCGARVEEGELVVQGKLVERIATWFEGRGYSRVVRGN